MANRTKITEEVYSEIKQVVLTPRMVLPAIRDVADAFGVCPSTVSEIKNSTDYEDYRVKLRRYRNNTKQRNQAD